MTDWSNTLIPAASGLIGAGVGAFAAWKVGVRMSEDAAVLAARERQQDAADREAERVRAAARSVRMVVIEVGLNFANVESVKAYGFEPEVAERLVAGALNARDKLVDALFRDGYHLPEVVFGRVEKFFHLIVKATLMNLTPDKVDGERLKGDVRNFGQYVRLSLEAAERGQPLPPPSDPPVVARGGTTPWLPDPLPSGWRSDE